MKRIYAISVAVLLCCFTATAQNVRFGLHGGANESHFSFESFTLNGTSISPANNGDLGWQAGAVLRIQIPGFIHIQPELNYQTRNISLFTAGENVADRRHDFRYSAIKLPVTVGFNIGSLRLFGGPVFTLDSSTENKSNTDSMNIKFDNNDVALMLGGGFEVKNFFIDLRYTTFNKSTKTKVIFDGGSHSARTLTNEFWEVSMGFFF